MREIHISEQLAAVKEERNVLQKELRASKVSIIQIQTLLFWRRLG